VSKVWSAPEKSLFHGGWDKFSLELGTWLVLVFYSWCYKLPVLVHSITSWMELIVSLLGHGLSSFDTFLAGSVRLFIHLETGSRIFVGCQLLTNRRVDNWVSIYHSWEQLRCPHDGLQLKGSDIHAPARPVTPRRLVQRQSTCPHTLLNQSLKDFHLPYITTLPINNCMDTVLWLSFRRIKILSSLGKVIYVMLPVALSTCHLSGFRVCRGAGVLALTTAPAPDISQCSDTHTVWGGFLQQRGQAILRIDFLIQNPPTYCVFQKS
jgi:hypothetical protein